MHLKTLVLLTCTAGISTIFWQIWQIRQQMPKITLTLKSAKISPSKCVFKLPPPEISPSKILHYTVHTMIQLYKLCT